MKTIKKDVSSNGSYFLNPTVIIELKELRNERQNMYTREGQMERMIANKTVVFDLH